MASVVPKKSFRRVLGVHTTPLFRYCMAILFTSLLEWVQPLVLGTTDWLGGVAPLSCPTWTCYEWQLSVCCGPMCLLLSIQATIHSSQVWTALCLSQFYQLKVPEQTPVEIPLGFGIFLWNIK